ncbi:MAG: DUF2878 domain-containing protein [Gammaproteobacteria bacterium]|nr:DUF2878 domain-containing protein [Gammaproteobacteria bacterium]
MISMIKNLTFFKIGWVACVMFAAAGSPQLSALSVAAVAAIHLVGVSAPLKEGLLLAAAALMGLCWETFLVWTGLLVYPGYENAALAPYWIVAMWVLFATTINHGLRWTKRNVWVAALAGGLGGPMAFFGGMNLGAVTFSSTPLALAVIGAGWAVLLPLLIVVADSIIDSPWLEPGEKPAEQRPAPTPRPMEVGYE